MLYDKWLGFQTGKDQSTRGGRHMRISISRLCLTCCAIVQRVTAQTIIYVWVSRWAALLTARRWVQRRERRPMTNQQISAYHSSFVFLIFSFSKSLEEALSSSGHHHHVGQVLESPHRAPSRRRSINFCLFSFCYSSADAKSIFLTSFSGGSPRCLIHHQLFFFLM